MNTIAALKKFTTPLIARYETLEEVNTLGLALFPQVAPAVVFQLVGCCGNTVTNGVLDLLKKPDTDKVGSDLIAIFEGESKGELAARLYPNMVIDCAVPQYVVDRLSRVFDNPARHLVTVYKNHAYDAPKAGNQTMVDGVVMPITDEGIYMLAVAATWSN